MKTIPQLISTNKGLIRNDLARISDILLSSSLSLSEDVSSITCPTQSKECQARDCIRGIFQEHQLTALLSDPRGKGGNFSFCEAINKDELNYLSRHTSNKQKGFTSLSYHLLLH